MDDRLAIDGKLQKKVVTESIDKFDILQLKSKGERIDIFMLALAIGVKEGTRTKSTSSNGFVLETTAKGKDLAISLITSVALQELLKENKENLINNPEIVYGIAEEYANTGLLFLDNLFTDITKTNVDDVLYELIEMMDTRFDVISKEL
jgi:hypothetical protein